MPDQRGLADAGRVEKAVERADEEIEIVAAPWLGREAESREVQGEDVGASRQGVDGPAPRFREPAEAVQEDDRGTASLSHVMHGEPVELPTLKPHF